MKPALSATIMGFILAAFGVLSADAQDLKAMLIKPANGWVIEWVNPASLDKGVSEVVFEDRGGTVVAKLNITNAGTYSAAVPMCERDVTIAADTISLNGCKDANIVLIVDPSDKTYPLKTKAKSSSGYEWKLREK